MRSMKQSPVMRVIRSRRPYTSARERWKERMDTQRREQQQSAADSFSRRSAVERVPVAEDQQEDSDRRDVEEREPCTNECAPLRYSEDSRGESCTVNDPYLIRQRLNEGNQRPIGSIARDNNDLESNGGRINLVALFKASSTPTNQLAVQGNGDVTTMDQRFQTMSVVQQQERRRAQRALNQEKSVATRRRVLMNILGMKRFYKTLSLVREVKGIRERLILQCATDPRTTNVKKVVVCKVKFDSLPRSGRDIMARTRLVAAIEQTEVERLAKLPWDELILEAHKNVMAYREWMSISETRE